MMSQKLFHHKGKNTLAILLSVFLGLSLCMNFIPLNTYAESEPTPEDQTENISAPIALTYNGQSTDLNTAYIMHTDNTGEKYYLSSISNGTSVVPAGTYSLYISDSETHTDIPVQDFTLTVDPNVPISFSVNYFCVRFIDRELLISKQYVSESGSLSEPVIPENFGHQWLGWSYTPSGSIVKLPVTITEDTTLYGIWECLVDPVTEPTPDSAPSTDPPASSELPPPPEQHDNPEPEIPQPEVPHTEHNYVWKYTEAEHWQICTAEGTCDVATINRAAHSFDNGTITKESTETTEGEKLYTCSECEYQKTEVIEKLVPPVITAGANQIYHTGSNTGLTVTCSGSLEDLTGVYADNSPIHKSNYTVTEGSTILTLHPAYLDSLAGGTHTLTLAYKNGTSAQTQFTIQKTASTVKTGDNENYIPLIILLILSAGVMIVTAVLHKKGLKG